MMQRESGNVPILHKREETTSDFEQKLKNTPNKESSVARRVMDLETISEYLESS